MKPKCKAPNVLNRPWLKIEGKIHDRPNYHMRDWQTILRHAVDSGEKRIVVVVCRRGGKDFSVMGEADILAMTEVGCNIGYLGLALKSVKKILMSNSEAGKPMYKDVIDCKGNMIRTRGGDYFHKEMSCFKYKNGSMIYILGTDQNMELGTSMKMLVITESARINFEKWSFLVPSIETQNGIIIHVSTPYFGSDFNDLVNGVHEFSDVYKIIKVTARDLHHADGTRVYSEEKLARIKKNMCPKKFAQEYECDTHAINSLSVIGEELEVAHTVPPRAFYDEHFYVFDLGQSDKTSMTCIGRNKGKQPTIYDYMIKNKTRLMDFSNAILEDMKQRKLNPRTCKVLLPFDGNQEMQGYSGAINRYQEMKNHLGKLGLTVELVTKVSKSRKLELLRHVLSTGLLAFEQTERCSNYIDILASVNYKEKKDTGDVIYEVDKYSGKHGDHPLDSTSYAPVYLFQNLFKEAYWEDHTEKYYRESQPMKVGDVFAKFRMSGVNRFDKKGKVKVGKKLTVDDVLQAYKEIDRLGR